MLNKIWKSYSRYLHISKEESLKALFYGICGVGLETFSIYLLANLISKIESGSIVFDEINVLSIPFNKDLYILVFLFSSISSAFIYYLSNKNIVKAKCIIERFIREEITDLTLNIKWEYYLRLSQGDISKSIVAEGQNISEGYMYFLQSMTNAFIAITYFFICLLLVPDTFLILILYGFLAYRVYLYYSVKAANYGTNLSSITSNIGNWTSSIFNNLKYIRTISKDKIAKAESKNIFLRFSDSYSMAMIASYKSKFVTEILTIIFIFLSILYILISKSSASNLILSLSLFVRMTPKVYNAQSRLLDSLAMISWPKNHKEKINWAKQYSENINNFSSKNFYFNGNIKIQSVNFNYPDCENIFEELNLEIKDNQSIGIIGKSGSGKSTLIDLLTGIVKPIKGNILISGININNLNINLWREQIGIVMQDNYFKNDSIAANIALGEKSFNEKRIIESLIKSGAWKFVRKLPNGIEEVIYDRGMRFSGGEKQKLSLARALYSNPNLLILDEPTTGLDYKSELEFISSIKKLLGSITVIIISHKKNIVQICDKVFILKNKNLKNLDS